MGPTFSRDEVLGGMPARRAQTILFAIEGRTARLAERSRRAMVRYDTERQQAEREREFLAALADARSDSRVRPQDMERFAPEWSSLVPRDPDSTAALASALLEKYAFRRRDATATATALRLGDPIVATAYERRQGRPVDDAFAGSLPARDRFRWWRARMAGRLESLPAAWTAFALTLTETIGAGILALPIAFAAAGPQAAVILLIVFGLANLLTIAGLVEAITRSETVRYGSTYVGRFVGEYLGASGNVTVSVATLLLSAVSLAVMILGFGVSAADITGVPAVIWAAVLAVGIMVILRRDSLDATVASVLVVGGINIVLLLLIVVVAFTAFDQANFSAGIPGAGSDRTALLGLIFGVAMMAFFGHTSASNAAKVVLARDPSGRSLLRGSVLAMGTALVLYLLFVVAVLGAVPASELIGFDGTALTPLVAATGPLVAATGLVFVALAMGLSSLHSSLSLYNQVGEHLPRSGAKATSRLASALSNPRGRAVAKAAPVVILLVIVEFMLVTGTGSFTDSLSFLGTVTLPLLAGVFPMMLLVATRRRGAYLPGRTTSVLGHPVVALAVSGLFFGGLLAHALVIWDDPLRRLTALVAAGAILYVVYAAWRDRAFRPRVFAEVRVEPGRSPVAIASVVSQGRRQGIPISWATDLGSSQEAIDEAALGSAEQLSEVTINLPGNGPTDLRVWVHQIDDEGVSTRWPAEVLIEDAGRSYALETNDDGVADREVSDAGSTIRIRRPTTRTGMHG